MGQISISIQTRGVPLLTQYSQQGGASFLLPSKHVLMDSLQLLIQWCDDNGIWIDSRLQLRRSDDGIAVFAISYIPAVETGKPLSISKTEHRSDCHFSSRQNTENSYTLRSIVCFLRKGSGVYRSN